MTQAALDLVCDNLRLAILAERALRNSQADPYWPRYVYEAHRALIFDAWIKMRQWNYNKIIWC